MGRLEDLREELEQLGREIEEDALRSRGRRTAKSGTGASIPETHVCLQLFIPQDSPRRWQISISMEQLDDGGPP